MADPGLASRVAAVRSFNRFYTRRMGLLEAAMLGSEFSLAEVRVLYEIAHERGVSASHLEARLGMDAGYLSRILRGFRERGLVRSSAAAHDARLRRLELTAKGRKELAPLERRSSEQVRRMFAAIPHDMQERLVAAMRSIEAALGGERAGLSYELRQARPGDFGWIVHRHGALYAAEYGWDATFEALVAEIVARFIRHRDAARERCWVAVRDEQIVGTVTLVRKSPAVAQLRLLLVEPSARGHGIGKALVERCIGFARSAGYRRMVLWTNDVLHAARHIYEAAGFRLVEQERHRSFGHDLVGQNWELDLQRR